MIADSDFSISTSTDLLITSSLPEQMIIVTISADRIAGEPIENFTISSMMAASSGANDAIFLFRNSVIKIVDEDSKWPEWKSAWLLIILSTCTGAQYQFRESDYAVDEGSDIVVVVEQVSGSLVPIHLKLTPLTYDQYTLRANQSGSDLAPLSTYHGSRPDAGERKCNNNIMLLLFATLYLWWHAFS